VSTVSFFTFLMSSRVSISGERPAWTQRYFSSTRAANGRQSNASMHASYSPFEYLTSAKKKRNQMSVECLEKNMKPWGNSGYFVNYQLKTLHINIYCYMFMRKIVDEHGGERRRVKIMFFSLNKHTNRGVPNGFFTASNTPRRLITKHLPIIEFCCTVGT
jgi:hypothetical protein